MPIIQGSDQDQPAVSASCVAMRVEPWSVRWFTVNSVFSAAHAAETASRGSIESSSMILALGGMKDVRLGVQDHREDTSGEEQVRRRSHSAQGGICRRVYTRYSP
jgi:hypothetical protein